MRFKDDELVLAVSPEHAFANKNELYIDEVLKGELILREKGSGTREILQDKLRDLGYHITDLKPYCIKEGIECINSILKIYKNWTIQKEEE